MLSGLLFYVRNLLFHVLLMFVLFGVCNLNLHGLCSSYFVDLVGGANGRVDR